MDSYVSQQGAVMTKRNVNQGQIRWDGLLEKEDALSSFDVIDDPVLDEPKAKCSGGSDGYGIDIRVFGVGGGGVNAIDTMIKEGVEDVEFIAVNTDAQHLKRSLADIKLALNTNTRGHGAGGDPDVGRAAAKAEEERIREFLEGTELLILATGLGGGTGTGASLAIAEIAKEMNILTLAIVTQPFSWEGSYKKEIADKGLEELTGLVDAYIRIPNDKMKKASGVPRSMREDFIELDRALAESVSAVVRVISNYGTINLDFADLRKALENGGLCVVTTASAVGSDAAMQAYEKAIKNPYLEDTPIEDAQRMLASLSMPAKTSGDVVAFINQQLEARREEKAFYKTGLRFKDEDEDEDNPDSFDIIIIATGMQDCVTVTEDEIIAAEEDPVEVQLQERHGYSGPRYRSGELGGGQVSIWPATGTAAHQIDNNPGVANPISAYGPPRIVYSVPPMQPRKPGQLGQPGQPVQPGQGVVAPRYSPNQTVVVVSDGQPRSEFEHQGTYPLNTRTNRK